MMLRRALAVAAGLLCFASAAQAQTDTQTPAPLTAHRTGQFDAVLPLRSPESSAEAWAERFQFGGDLTSWDYDLAHERFSLYVPPDYDPDGEPYGVVVWISANSIGRIPEELKRLFDERHLIWIGPYDAGNQRHLFPRTGLVIDAALNAQQSYHVDPDRIFVSGMSGGGRVATMAAVLWGDVFKGGMPIVGVTSYLDVPIPSSPGQSVLRFAAPSPDVLQAAKRQPFVIITGNGDFNEEECQLVAAAYRGDGFTDLHLLDIPGMGHEMPSVPNFAAGLDLLLSAQ